MNQNNKLKLFISYSHKDNSVDNSYIDQFKKHLAPLKRNGSIEEWFDRKIQSGDTFQEIIDNNLEDADIICLFISANFLDSDNCMREKDKAMELRKLKGTTVIPVILSACGWKDDKDIANLLALPTDGQPVSAFVNREDAWQNVYEGLKNKAEMVKRIQLLEITEEFNEFLQDTDILTKAHSRKERVVLDDIFIYPELDKYDDLRKYNKKISAEELLKNLLKYPKIALAGEEQSGKTTLCKMIFRELRKKNHVPVYIYDRENSLLGKIDNKISKALKAQYKELDIKDIDSNRIVPIIDDFYLAKNKEILINDLSKYAHCVIIIDDIFSLNIKDEQAIGLFSHFKIKELKPSLRWQLIKTWVNLTDKTNTHPSDDNSFYRAVDKDTELVDSTLGKTVGRGIMPAYPFFILSTLVTYETFEMPLDQEITSQGYCYQAFIYFYLRKRGVKNDDIDTYLNFLTEIAYYFYKANKHELSPDDFASFMKSYLEKYSLPIKQDILLDKLGEILSQNGFSNYVFRHQYLYYFFVAKYMAEHINETDVNTKIDRIVDNLHVNENAYISIFVAHHSKNAEILNTIVIKALCLFDKYEPATLTKDELEFFDKEANSIVKAALPSATPEKVRADKLEIQDKMEKSKDIPEEDFSKKDSLEIDLRQAIKTVEVMGHIIKNRAGSLPKTRLEEIYEEAMKVHLRILSSFFELLKSKEEQEATINFLAKRLEKISEGKKRKPTRDELEKISRIYFWNLNFFVVYGVISKIVHSLGSDKLTEIIKKACDEMNTPASFIVRHAILMWYDKNIRIDEIAEGIKSEEFSEIARRVMKLAVVEYTSMHSLKHLETQRIQSVLQIPTIKLLTSGNEKS